ncbi:MAG TPA: hypothetical protein VHV55_15275 [Pirellulales bacterium]|nr:hypothetical protein [Pirellulales bacterium]
MNLTVYNNQVVIIQWLHDALNQFEHFRFLAKAVLPESEINVLRQGFILLMTAFDAAIFDLLRVALAEDFFSLIPRLAKDGSVKLKDMSKFKDFSEFSSSVIETQLKARYVKDLLLFLSASGVQLFDQESDNLATLLELVQRRNVHVHNRGYVDERYLERDENDKPKWNLDNLSLGQVAVIDHAYWERTSMMTTTCVNAVASWIDAGAPAK